MVEEIFKEIAGFEGKYSISNLGKVKSHEKIVKANIKNNIYTKRPERELKIYFNNAGYCYVILTDNYKPHKRYIHRLVAQAFIDNSLNKEEVNHIDGNKQNNCVGNLEWVTHEENMHHAFENKLIDVSKRKPRKGGEKSVKRRYNKIYYRT